MLLNAGDKVTITGHYKRRTLWQWLMRKPKKLQEFEVKYATTASAKFSGSETWERGSGWEIKV